METAFSAYPPVVSLEFSTWNQPPEEMKAANRLWFAGRVLRFQKENPQVTATWGLGVQGNYQI